MASLTGTPHYNVHSTHLATDVADISSLDYSLLPSSLVNILYRRGYIPTVFLHSNLIFIFKGGSSKSQFSIPQPHATQGMQSVFSVSSTRCTLMTAQSMMHACHTTLHSQRCMRVTKVLMKPDEACSALVTCMPYCVQYIISCH